MKKYFLIFLAIVLAVSVMTTTASAAYGANFQVSDVTGKPGETAEILVHIPSYTDADTMGLLYTLPEGITLVEAAWLVDGLVTDTESEPNAAAWANPDPVILHGDVFKLTVKIEDAAEDDVALDVEVTLKVKFGALEAFSETVTAKIVSHVTHNERKTTVQPTCTEDGYYNYVCTICGAERKDYAVELEAGGHKYGDWEHDKENPPTCEKGGKEIHYCTCGDSETRDAGKLGHKFTTYTSDNNATCTKDGTKTATCDREGCNKKDTVTDPGTRKAHADANKDHKCDSCGTAQGTHAAASGKHTCDYCGKAVTTCADGNKDHKCDVCAK